VSPLVGEDELGESLCDLLKAALEQTTTDTEDRLLVEDYLRYRFTREDRSLLSAHEIHGLTSKLMYLLNLAAVLVVIGVPVGRQRLQAVKRRMKKRRRRRRKKSCCNPVVWIGNYGHWQTLSWVRRQGLMP
jgi:CelD/BcsL family acetyltransferase involved in cellulose biosynthesis